MSLKAHEMLLHDYQDLDELLAVVSREQAVDPGLVEEDYWIMHAFWGCSSWAFALSSKAERRSRQGMALSIAFPRTSTS